MSDERTVVRALRAAPAIVAEPSSWRLLLRRARRSSISAIVIDLKESHVLYHDTAVTTAHEIDAVHVLYDLSALIGAVEESGLKAIARLAAFEDTKLAEAYPDLALRNASSGEVWLNEDGRAWLDPTKEASWEYITELAVEAAGMGFMEVQLDYVRFPTGDGVAGQAWQQAPQEQRVTAITNFAERITGAVREAGSLAAIDIFGITTRAADDQGIGQRLEELAAVVDVLCPMVYPSHYSPGWAGMAQPAESPGVVVGLALDAAIKRAGDTRIRPWLQGWGMPPESILAQMQAAEQRGLGWMMWHPRSDFEAVLD